MKFVCDCGKGSVELTGDATMLVHNGSIKCTHCGGPLREQNILEKSLDAVDRLQKEQPDLVREAVEEGIRLFPARMSFDEFKAKADEYFAKYTAEELRARYDAYIKEIEE